MGRVLTIFCSGLVLFSSALSALSACSLSTTSVDRFFHPGVPLTAWPWGSTKQFGVVGKTTAGTGIASDSAGNIFIGGITTGALPGNSLTGTVDVFVGKYALWGERQWLLQFGPSTGGALMIFGMAVDPWGNVVVAGTTGGSLQGIPLTGAGDLFISKYTSSGERLWTKLLGAAASNTIAMDLDTDAAGNIFVTGQTSVSLSGTSDLILVKYNSSGETQWTRMLGGAGGETMGYGVATDRDGFVYVVGYSNVSIDGNPLIGSQDLILLKYNSSGEKQWSVQHGVAGSETTGTSVALDRDGNLYLAGAASGALDGNSLTGSKDAFLIKYNTHGNRQWTTLLGGAGGETLALGVAVDGEDLIYISGYTEVGLNGKEVTGTTDYFLSKFNSVGSLQWLKQEGIPSKEVQGRSVACDPYGNVFLIGYTQGGLDGNPITGTQDAFLMKFNSLGEKQ